MQFFGSDWTLIKLDILEKYFAAYMVALKKQRFNTVYIDAFSGSGKEIIRTGKELEGSPLIALKYNFDRYIFIDKNKEYINQLKSEINSNPENRNKTIMYVIEDCNCFLQKYLTENPLNNYERGIIFLDPFALQVNWHTLKIISQTNKLDVWYLFNISALIRCLRRDGKFDEPLTIKINSILGTEEWFDELYKRNNQLNMFNEIEYSRDNIQDVLVYVKKRLKTLFPAVCDSPKQLKLQEKNIVLFSLFFMCSNPSKGAVKLSLNLADYILKKS